MVIEVFCRYTTGATNAAERRVLRRVVEILERNRHSAVILCDFFCGGQQIDLLVATEITTLVLQVKNYRHPAEGTMNSAFWRNPATGETLPNAYTQATNQMLSLKDMVIARAGVDPGFARAVVLFEQGIPVGSSLPPSDFRVQICNMEGIEALLLTHTSERSGRVPWDQGLIRSYAIEEGMARLPETSLRKPLIRATAPSSSQYSTRPAPTDRSVNVVDVPARVVPVAMTARLVEQTVQTLSHTHALKQPQRLRKRRWYAAAAVAIGLGLGWLYRPTPKPASSIVSTASTRAPLHGAAEFRRHRGHMQYASRKSPGSSSPPEPTGIAAAPVQTPVIMQNAAPLPPCPVGTDRLGCTASSETLARLSGQ
ncbi:nuclease-related domain-containing protein [Paraburkholderia nemoris]|uniref:nuclease-related domain-containing protein n=1 Tax=Paraburkholderia nemoris TaxID=2793076 RepID=UPI0038B82A63